MIATPTPHRRSPVDGSELGLHPGEELAGHDDALHLVGALVDLGDLLPLSENVV
ncbi:MAG: hypothetical protein JWP56_662 [Aeromicrobium sp.]|nr:hypothetical protein [Aeromicrobium sp.]